MELTILKPEATASPHYLSRKTHIPLPMIEAILSSLAHDAVIEARFFIFCNNDDPELVHGFDFTSKKELRDFIVENKFSCPNCEFKLNTQNIRVAFIKKELPSKAL